MSAAPPLLTYGTADQRPAPRRAAGPVFDPKRDQILVADLRTARRQAGWSQATLAGRIGVDAQLVKRLEQGVG